MTWHIIFGQSERGDRVIKRKDLAWIGDALTMSKNKTNHSW